MKPIPLKTAAKLSITFSILGILLLAIGICIGTNVGLIVLIIGLIILLGTIIFIGLFYRCPYCEGFLTVPYRSHYCPHCGKYLT